MTSRRQRYLSELPCGHHLYIVHSNGAKECRICRRIFITPNLIPLYSGSFYEDIVEVIDDKEEGLDK